MDIDKRIRKQPQFQQEWERLQNQLESQYTNHLTYNYIRELTEMA